MATALLATSVPLLATRNLVPPAAPFITPLRFSVLEFVTASVPTPVVRTPSLKLRVPPLNSTVAPELAVYRPVSVPLASIVSVPASAFTVPVLLNVNDAVPKFELNARISLTVWLSVPSLVNVAVPDTRCTGELNEVLLRLNVAPASLISVLSVPPKVLPNSRRSSPPTVSVPRFRQILPSVRLTQPSPSIVLIVLVPCVISVPAPRR